MKRITATCFLLLLACATSDTIKVPEPFNVAVDSSNIAIPNSPFDEVSFLPIVKTREISPKYHHLSTRAVDLNATLAAQAAQERLQSIYSVAGFQIGQLAQSLQAPTVASFTSLDIVGLLQNPESLKNFVTNVNQTVATFLSLIIVIGIFLIIGILMLVVATVFGCCRLCNRCGGKYPKKTGYSVRQILIVSVLIVAFSLIVWFFAAMVFVHSSEVSRSITSIQLGVTDVLGDIRSMIQNANTVVSGAGTQINTGTQQIITDLQAYNVSSPVALLLTPAFDQVYDSLISLANTISDSTAAATQSDALLIGIKNDVDSTRNQLTSIKSDIDALGTVNVNGQTITLTLPDTSALEPENVPDSASIPDISGYITKLNSAPDLTQVAADSKTTYDDFTDGLPGTYNDTVQTLKTKIGSPGDSVVSMAENMQTQLASVDTTIADFETTLTGTYEPSVTKTDAIRNDATKGIMIVLIVPFALAFIGVIVQKRKCVSFLAPICAIFVFLASVQFILYYVISIPLNGYCTSKGTILQTLYTLSENATIQPQLILDNCKDGQSLLTMQVSTDNSTLSDFVGLGAVLGGNYSSFIGNFSDSIAFPTTTLPSSSTQLDQLDSLDLSSLNFTAYTVDFTPIDIGTAKSTLQDFGASLTPQTFDPSWTQSALDQSIADFNTLVQQTEPSFTGFTYATIEQTYLTPGTAFQASDVTSVGAAQAQIQTNFDTNVYPDANFRFGADKEIVRLQGDINAIGVKLDTLQTTGLTPLTDKATSLKTNIGTLETLIGSIDGTAATLVSSTNQFAGVVGMTVDTIKEQIIDLIETGVDSVFGGLVGNFVDVGKCSALAFDLDFAQETVCTNTVVSTNVLWFSFSVICISCLISFILGIKGQKRIGCRRLIAPAEETALKKKKALEEF